MFQKELNESEHMVFQAVHGLQRALQGDYRDVVNVKESSRQRLEALREAAIKVRTVSVYYWDQVFIKSSYLRYHIWIFQVSDVVLCIPLLILIIFNHVIEKCNFKCI